MPLTPNEAFKVGFLARCVEAGLSPSEMLKTAEDAAALMEKAAIVGVFGDVIGKLIDTGKSLGGAALSYGIPAAAIAPPVLGGLAGFGAAKMTDLDDTDVNDVKDREVIDEYKRQTELLRQRLAARQYSKENRPQARPLL